MMADTLEKRRPISAALRKRSRATHPRKSAQTRVRLEQVFGFTVSSLSSSSGILAYPAGCVLVLLDPITNKQNHILNSARKSFSALSFSHDGKLLVTGESGHLPCVRVFNLQGALKAEVQTHKYGVSCVCFSRSDVYVVSVGFQHDMNVCVWDWRRNVVVASNKVSSRVSSVSFSDDGSFFVTAGTRHLKFWYLNQSAHNRVNSTVPLTGRSALLGDHKNCVFVAVACGRGGASGSTFCLTSSGLLCVFNHQRNLQAWVHLKVSSSFSLVSSEDRIFCGCSEGLVRVFSPDLTYITTVRRQGAQLPNTLALTFDAETRLLSAVYSDHSISTYRMDMNQDQDQDQDQDQVFYVQYHRGCVWGLEMFPDLDVSDPCSSHGSFFSSSSDNTIRVWTKDPLYCYSQDPLRTLVVASNSETEADGKSGLRVLAVSPDGAHLATGDRHGNVSIFSLDFLEEVQRIEAHNSEVLCLTFSPLDSGVRLLASASRDRLIHIFNRDQDYNLIQTLYDHSGAVTAVRITGCSPDLQIVSCGTDKSIYVQTQTEAGLMFSRCHHIVEKSSLYDMDLDLARKRPGPGQDHTRTQAAFACQDRYIRVYSVDSGKLTKTLKGSCSDEGVLLKVAFDPSGSFIASSGSDRSICIHDYESGECVAALYGHSEIVTSIQFSSDGRHLITASADSCIFVWCLDASMTSLIRKRRGLDRKCQIRRETFISGPANQSKEGEESELLTPGRTDTLSDVPLLQTNGKLPLWFRKLGEGGAPPPLSQSHAENPQIRKRWAEQMYPIRVLSETSPSPIQDKDQDQDHDQNPEGEFFPLSLESLLLEEDEGSESVGVVNCCALDRDFEDLSQEGNQDTDCESLSSCSSAPVLETDFNLETECFHTDLALLQPPDQKHFLQPRLSLSTRFLSRYQDRIRSKTQISVPKILEESSIDNFKVQSRSGSGSALKDVGLQKREGRRIVIGRRHGAHHASGRRTHTPVTVQCRRRTDGFNSRLPPLEILGNAVQPKISDFQDLGPRPGPRPDLGLQQCGKENLDPDHGPDLKLVAQSPDPVAQSPDPVAQSPDPVAQSPDPVAQSPDPVAQSPDPVAQSPDPVAQSPHGDVSCKHLTTPPDSLTTPPDSLTMPPDPLTTPGELCKISVKQEVTDDVTSCSARDYHRPRPLLGEQEVMQAAETLRRTTEETLQLYREVQSDTTLASVLLSAFEDLNSKIKDICESSPRGGGGDCSSRVKGGVDCSSRGGEGDTSSPRRGDCSSRGERGDCSSRGERGDCSSRGERGDCSSRGERGDCGSRGGDCGSRGGDCGSRGGDCSSRGERGGGGDCCSTGGGGDCCSRGGGGDCCSRGGDGDCTSPCGHVMKCSLMMKLLERYSELLLQATRDKLKE